MSLKSKEVVWTLFVIILAISVLQADASTRRTRRSRYRSSSSSSSSGGGGSSWIAGVVIGVILVVLIIVVVFRCYWTNKHGMPFCGGQRRVGSVKDVRDESTVVNTTSQPNGQAMSPPPAYSEPAYPPLTEPAYPPLTDPAYPPQKY